MIIKPIEYVDFNHDSMDLRKESDSKKMLNKNTSKEVKDDFKSTFDLELLKIKSEG